MRPGRRISKGWPRARQQCIRGASAYGGGLPGSDDGAGVPATSDGAGTLARHLPETAPPATSRRFTTRSSVAPLPYAVVWSREVLRGDVNHPSIDDMDGVAGSIVARPASELRDELNKATCVNGSGRHRSWSASSQRLAVGEPPATEALRDLSGLLRGGWLDLEAEAADNPVLGDLETPAGAHQRSPPSLPGAMLA
jgi:hypothetical protein